MELKKKNDGVEIIRERKIIRIGEICILHFFYIFNLCQVIPFSFTLHTRKEKFIVEEFVVFPTSLKVGDLFTYTFRSTLLIYFTLH